MELRDGKWHHRTGTPLIHHTPAHQLSSVQANVNTSYHRQWHPPLQLDWLLLPQVIDMQRPVVFDPLSLTP